MELFVWFIAIGAAMVGSCAAQNSMPNDRDADIYTDYLRFKFSPNRMIPPAGDNPTQNPAETTGRQPRQKVVGPPDARNPTMHPGAKASARTGRGRNWETSADVVDGRPASRATLRKASKALAGSVEPESMSSPSDLDNRFQVPTVDNTVEQFFLTLGQDAPEKQWTDPLAVDGMPPHRGKNSKLPADEDLALLSELGSGVRPEHHEALTPSVSLRITEPQFPDVAQGALPSKLNFKDYSLTSIADHQKRQKVEDSLSPRHNRMVLSSDPTSAHDALHIRQVGPLCGVFDSPLVSAELRALNESAFLLRNVYINSIIRYDKLRVVFEGPDVVMQLDLKFDPSEKLLIHTGEFVLDTTLILAKLDKATLEDNFNQLSASLNISGCRRPSSLWGPPLEGTKNGVSSGKIVLHTANLMVIKSFTYPGGCPAAFFWAGNGRDPEDGFKVPTLDRGFKPLRPYHKKDVVLMLPEAVTFYDLDYIGVYCPAQHEMLGHHLFKSSLRTHVVLPPAFTTSDRLEHPRLNA